MRLPGAADHLRRRRERRPAAALRDHRRARRHIHPFAALRQLAARSARALSGLPTQALDRVPAALRGHPADSTAGQSDRATPAALHPTALGRPRRRLPARGEPRAALRAVRRTGARLHHDADREPRGRQARRAGGRLRARRGRADAAARARRPACGGTDPSPQPAEPNGPGDPGRRDGPLGSLDRVQRRQDAPDQDRRLHPVAAEGRAQLLHAQAARSALPDRRAGLERAEGLRAGAGLQRHLDVDQLEAGDDLVASRQGRARRLLDLLVHQLPAHAAAPQDVGCRLPEGGPADRRRAHARVRVRARPFQRPQGDARARRPLRGRDRQRLQDVGRVPERRLADRVPRRPDAATSARSRRARATTTTPSGRFASCSASPRRGSSHPSPTRPLSTWR